MRTSNKSSLPATKSQRPRLSKEEVSQALYKLKKIKYPVRPISNAIMIKKKIASFPERVAHQLKKSISQNLNAYRQVRGDGNCFFRAFAFSFIANRASTQFSQIFSYFEEISFDCCYSQTIPKEFKPLYSDIILRSVLYSIWSKQYQFHFKENGRNYRRALSKMLNENHYLDFIIILYFRSLCFYAFDKKKEQYKDFLTGGNQEQNIRSYGTESQGLIFELCSKFLNININIFEIRKNQVVSYNYCVLRGQSKTKQEIDLLFYDKHYDLFQDNQEPLAQYEDQYEVQSRYSRVNNDLTKGQCIQCGIVGQIGQETGICLNCFNQSIKNFDKYKKDRQIIGVCGQCQRKTSNLSQQLMMCQDCLKKIQSDYHESRIISQLRKYPCQKCHKLSNALNYNNVCHECSEKINSPNKNIGQAKRCSHCREDKKEYELDKTTGLCKLCDAILMKNSNSSISSKISQACKICRSKKFAQFNDEGICYQCVEKYNKQKHLSKIGQSSNLGASSLRNQVIPSASKNQSSISLQFSSLHGKFQSKIKKQSSSTQNSNVMKAKIFSTRKCTICKNLLQPESGNYCEGCESKIKKQSLQDKQKRK